MQANVIDRADQTRAPWEMDDEEIADFDDPFDDELSPEEEAERERFLHTEYKRMGIEARREMRSAIFDQHPGLDAMEIMHERNEGAEGFDYAARNYLGLSKNWDSEDSRAARDKRKEQKAARGFLATKLASTPTRADVSSTPQSTPQNRDNYAVAIEPEFIEDSGETPQPILENTKRDEPTREEIAHTLPLCLAPLLKGLSIVKRRAFEEIIAAKIENRAPALWVSGVSQSTRRELDRRLELAWSDAKTYASARRRAALEREARRLAMREVLRPELAAALYEAARLLAQYPYARAELVTAIREVLEDFERTARENCAPNCLAPENIFKVRFYFSGRAVKAARFAVHLAELGRRNARKAVSC